MALFEVAVTVKKEDEKKEKIVVDIQTIVAKDAESAKRQAVRLIPNDVDLDTAQVFVRPFA